jgi:hypothetical protein
MSILSGLGRTVETLSKPSSLMAIGAGSFALGMFNKAAPAARDALLDVSMGDPNADVAFTGRKLSPTFLAGQHFGGAAKVIGNAANPMDYASTGQPLAQSLRMMGSPVGIAAGTVATGALGVGGAIGGNKLGKTLGGIFGPTGKTIGGIVGGIAGGMAGVGIGLAPPVAMVTGHVKRNQRFYSESPYAGNSSLTNALALNATGDIVLGMHNSRRGY